MRKTRDLFKKIRDTKNTSYKDGHNKGKKRYQPNRSRNIRKKWQENIEKVYKKDLNDPDKHDDVITHLEPGTIYKFWFPGVGR